MSVQDIKVFCCDCCSVLATGVVIDIDCADEREAKVKLIKVGWVFNKGCSKCEGDYCPSCAEMKGIDW